MKIKTVTTTATLSTTAVSIVTNYKSLLTISPYTAPTCDLTIALTVDEEEYASATLPSGSTTSITFNTTYNTYAITATPVDSSNKCTLANADIIVQNRV